MSQPYTHGKPSESSLVSSLNDVRMNSVERAIAKKYFHQAEVIIDFIFAAAGRIRVLARHRKNRISPPAERQHESYL
jgi:hypothetical protein